MGFYFWSMIVTKFSFESFLWLIKFFSWVQRFQHVITSNYDEWMNRIKITDNIQIIIWMFFFKKIAIKKEYVYFSSLVLIMFSRMTLSWKKKITRMIGISIYRYLKEKEFMSQLHLNVARSRNDLHAPRNHHSFRSPAFVWINLRYSSHT